MFKTNSISLAVHIAMLILFLIFVSYISYLSRVFTILQESYAPYIVYSLLSVIAYFFAGFYICSVSRIRTKGLKNAASVCIVALIGIAIWSYTILNSNYSGAVSDGFEWIFFYLFFMHFVSLTNLMPGYVLPQYLFVFISIVPTLLMWAGIEYRASIGRRIAGN